MNSREKLILTITTEVLIAVIAIAFIFRGPSTKVASTAASPSPRAVPTNTNMSPGGQVNDHHGAPKPADNNLFSSLLNKPAPDFTLTSFDGKKYSLSELRGKNIVLFFNEGIMCYPACWNQIAAFGKDKQFAEKNTVVFSINVDAKGDWANAVKKMPELASGTVLLDSDKSVVTAYGVLTLESSMHRGQFPGHTYVIIDKDGLVRYTLDDPQMAIRNKEILSEIAKL